MLGNPGCDDGSAGIRNRRSMHDSDISSSISLGGPNGIRIGQAAPVEREYAHSVRLADRRASGTIQRSLATHGRFVVGGLASLGAVVLLSWIALVSSLSLPGLLYLPGVVVAGVLWTAAAAIHRLSGESRHALAAARERDILGLAMRARGPLTVADVAHVLGLSLAEAEAALTAMSRTGHVIPDIDLDTGLLRFSLSARPAVLSQELL